MPFVLSLKPTEPSNASVSQQTAIRDNYEKADRVVTAAFVGHVGFWSHHLKEKNSLWPFPANADCTMLAVKAKLAA